MLRSTNEVSGEIRLDWVTGSGMFFLNDDTIDPIQQARFLDAVRMARANCEVISETSWNNGLVLLFTSKILSDASIG